LIDELIAFRNRPISESQSVGYVKAAIAAEKNLTVQDSAPEPAKKPAKKRAKK
jgi:hypothetical protein